MRYRPDRWNRHCSLLLPSHRHSRNAVLSAWSGLCLLREIRIEVRNSHRLQSRADISICHFAYCTRRIGCRQTPRIDSRSIGDILDSRRACYQGFERKETSPASGHCSFGVRMRSMGPRGFRVRGGASQSDALSKRFS